MTFLLLVNNEEGRSNSYNIIPFSYLYYFPNIQFTIEEEQELRNCHKRITKQINNQQESTEAVCHVIKQ